MDVPVVLVHGLRASRTMWRRQLAALERLGIPALAVDLPGHGARVGGTFTVDDGVATIERAVDELGGSALVVGVSLGAYVAIAHAARRPDQVAGLVAAACSTRPHRLVVAAWSRAAAVLEGFADHGAAVNDWFVAHTIPAAGARDLAAGGYALEATTGVLRAMAREDPVADLRAVQAPVWLVNGRFDHFRGEERRFLAACRDGRLVVVPGATHLVNLTQPVRFTRVLLEVHAEVSAR
ncbi:alpha/beta fold hydrolase [Cellulomonas alba]|uniref:Alpha/beta hydrolase n=1 Tax=Cellulomonas alba TaxID=3053467 RepID=A0ABT7SDP8_9CELL|nr:alpha/beta hydrolase [Cellulomonas alba]MDM7854307.1 alpha/beta hydrolase [Cellulomonas alba]